MTRTRARKAWWKLHDYPETWSVIVSGGGSVEVEGMSGLTCNWGLCLWMERQCSGQLPLKLCRHFGQLFRSV